MLHTPILLIVFNRLDTAQQVFNKIREVRPQSLYIACDGSRLSHPNEARACEETKDLIKQVDWDCNVHTMFLTENIGPSKAPYKFIKWFFEHEKQGIILEHDCLPHTDFFYYCEELLDKFQNNPEIGSISGSNFCLETNTKSSYTYTAYNHIWGWATWRRTIDKYTLNLTDFSNKEFKDLLYEYSFSYKEMFYWQTIFKQIKKGEIPTWDYFLTFCLWRHHCYSISPNKNLVSNIGFGEGAVNTTDINSPLANRKVYPIMPLIQNNAPIEQNRKQEENYFKTYIMENKPAYWLYIKLILKRLGLFNKVMKTIAKIKNYLHA